MSEPPTPREARIVRPPSGTQYTDTEVEDDLYNDLPLFKGEERHPQTQRGSSLRDQLEEIKRDKEREEALLDKLREPREPPESRDSREVPRSQGSQGSLKQDKRPPSSLSNTSSASSRSKVNLSVQVPSSHQNISKTHRVMTTVGSIEELQCLIGRVKARYFNPQKTSEVGSTFSRKMFFYARMTQIQEALNDLTRSLLTTTYDKGKFNRARFPSSHTIELQGEMKGTIGESDTVVIAGTTELEADLLICRSVARRVERQLLSSADDKLGVVVDAEALRYIETLSLYLNSLALHILSMNMKNSLKIAK